MFKSSLRYFLIKYIDIKKINVKNETNILIFNMII